MSERHPFVLGLNARVPDGPLSTGDFFDLVGHNSGNLAFAHALHQHLGITRTVPWHAPLETIRQAGDVAVVPCANQLGPHANLCDFVESFSRLPQPLIAIGLGAQTGLGQRLPEVPEGTLNWVRAIISHAAGAFPNIAVRGPFSHDVLRRYGLGDSAVILGCPSLFISRDPHLGRTIAGRLTSPSRIAIAAGHFQWPELATLEASLARMVGETDGSYIVQSPIEMVALARGDAGSLNAELLLQIRDYVMPGSAPEKFLEWCTHRARVFSSVPEWMGHLSGMDFVVGTRIHGVMLALQAGIPALCVVHDARTLELCEVMKVPHVDYLRVRDGMRREALLDMFEFDAVAFDENRRMLCRRYLEFLDRNGLAAASWLREIAAGR